jgi:polyphosphate kinase
MMQPGSDGEFPALTRALADAAAGPTGLNRGDLLNMETSYLAFEERVLDLASSPNAPLLERVRYLSIFGSNLDEFFRTRVAGFQRQVALGNRKRTLDGLTPDEQLELIRARTRELLELAYGTVLRRLLGDLGSHGIELVDPEGLSSEEARHVRTHYGHGIPALLRPLFVHGGRPFPHVRNLRPALLVRLSSRTSAEPCHAIVELPGDATGLVPLPGGRRFLPMEEVVRQALPEIFPGWFVEEAHVFRVTRGGNLSVDASRAADVVEAVAEDVARRPFQPVVRLEVARAMGSALAGLLLEALAAEASRGSSALTEQDLYRVDGPLDLKRLEQVASLPIPALRFPRARRTTPFDADAPVVDQLRDREVLVAFPRHSFDRTVQRFLSEAAEDPEVEEIRITLYRTSKTSKIVRLLSEAKLRGKRVVAFVEVKASFDEARNIEWAQRLAAAGIEVLHGPPSLKVHAKTAVVVRREAGERRAYTYVGTGNLNASTAASYTDLGLFSSDQRTGAEVLAIFDTLEGAHGPYTFERLLVAPFTMRHGFIQRIEREARNARAGLPASIRAKLNGLADREVIAALYGASRAGVRVELSIRGICSLRPGVPGLSERIRVVAIAGRYLEHSRIFRFENDGDPDYLIGSADWRGRNLSRRVEVVTPVEGAEHRRALDRLIERDLTDPDRWELAPDGRYVRSGGSPTGAAELGATERVETETGR